jgi:hypothetical protein
VQEERRLVALRKLPKTPFRGNYDAKFGSSVGGIVSELPTNRKLR